MILAVQGELRQAQGPKVLELNPVCGPVFTAHLLTTQAKCYVRCVPYLRETVQHMTSLTEDLFEREKERHRWQHTFSLLLHSLLFLPWFTCITVCGSHFQKTASSKCRCLYACMHAYVCMCVCVCVCVCIYIYIYIYSVWTYNCVQRAHTHAHMFTQLNCTYMQADTYTYNDICIYKI